MPRIYWLFEGASEIQRLVISRANGGIVKSCGSPVLHDHAATS